MYLPFLFFLPGYSVEVRDYRRAIGIHTKEVAISISREQSQCHNPNAVLVLKPSPHLCLPPSSPFSPVLKRFYSWSWLASQPVDDKRT